MPYVIDPTATIPAPPAVSTSSDGRVTATLDEEHAGIKLVADYSDDPEVVSVLFLREDGTRVRSGDPAPVIGGIAVAYDHEAPLGEVTAWYAIPQGPGMPNFVPSADATDVSGYVITNPVEITPKMGTYEAWPQLYVTPGGAWLLAHRANEAHLPTGEGRGIVRRSTDEGLSWDVVADIGEAGENWGGAFIAIAQDDTMTLITTRNVTGQQGGNDEFIMWHSDDDGLTWTEGDWYYWPQVATFFRPLTLQNGDLLVPYHGQGWGMARSSDNGQTWSIYSTANGGPWMSEAQMVQAPNGTIIGLGRASRLILFYSYDNGFTFTKGVDSGISPNTGGNANTEAMYIDGDRIHVVWISRDDFKMYHNESTVTAVLAHPGAWSPAQEVAQLPGNRRADIGYPTMIKNQAGRFVLAWYMDPDESMTPSIYMSTLFDLAVENDPDANASAVASLFVPAPAEAHYVWVKSLAEPGLSVLARVWGDAPDVVQDARQESAAVYGSPYPAMAFDAWSAGTQAWQFYCELADDHSRLDRCLRSGVVLIQPAPETDIAPFYALAGQITRARTESYRTTDSIVDVSSFTTVERPATKDSPLIIPGYSWRDFLAATQTWGQVEAVYPTWGDAIGGV